MNPPTLPATARDPGVAHRIVDVLRARGHEVGHLLPIALGGRQGDVQANAPIPASCLFHGNARRVEPLPACPHCGGSGRVPFESDEYPPGTNACCCTCSGCRSEKVTIPAADVSALTLAASVVGVELGRGVVRGVLGEWHMHGNAWVRTTYAGTLAWPSCNAGGWDIADYTPGGHRLPSLASGPETGAEGRAAADAALLRLGFAYPDPSAPFGVVVPFLSSSKEAAEGRQPSLEISMSLAPHQQRVVDELAEYDAFTIKMKDRTDKLVAFLERPDFTTIVTSTAEQARLRRQYHQMMVVLSDLGSVRNTLTERIANF